MGKVLYEKEAEDFLEKEGFPIAIRRFAKTEDSAVKGARSIGYPVALKVSSKKVLHKSDVGGVKIDLRNDDEVRKAFRSIKKIKYFNEAIVQEYSKGVFILIGLKKDPNFGHAIVVGSGGIYTEILKDVSFRICPIEKKDAEEMLKELKMYPLLTGVRGGKKINIGKLSNVLVKMSKLVLKYPEISELDINPLIANDKSLKIVDVRIVF